METGLKYNKSENYYKQGNQNNWNSSSNWNQGDYKTHKSYKPVYNFYNFFSTIPNPGAKTTTTTPLNNPSNLFKSKNTFLTYSSYSNQNYHQNQEAVDPYTAESVIYRAEMYILLRYPNLVDYNSKNTELLNSVDEKSQFFVIKSFSEEDVHKSIKYGLWTSTKSGNYTLNNAFRTAAQNGGHVYLFYSTNASGRFVGLARMKSEVNFADSFSYWTQDNKWTGVFQLEWLFIKDTPFKLFRSISILMKDGQRKPVCNSRDTQEVPFEDSFKMIEIIQNFKNTNTILEHFEYYDIRQENYEKLSNPNKLANE